jgi:hypothetical protein|tara:strand:+ start:696 stop:896 length:201 start_codon:yes stop_codon:yes gene_type:complete
MDNVNFMKMFLTMQDMSMDNSTSIKDKVKAKERIVFATHGIIKPSDWAELTDEVKLNRLNKLQTIK